MEKHLFAHLCHRLLLEACEQPSDGRVGLQEGPDESGGLGCLDARNVRNPLGTHPVDDAEVDRLADPALCRGDLCEYHREGGRGVTDCPG